MSSSYHFLPWARDGLAGRVRDPRAGEDPRRGHVTVTASLNGEAVEQLPAVETLGPGDVVGISPGQVVRTDPVAGAVGFEPGYYPSVDLDSPTLPWLFTPAQPVADRLTPWLCLVVVRQQPGVRLRVDGLRDTTVLEIGAPADARRELPDLSQAWAWAHVQVVGAADPGAVASEMTTAPERTVSRLVCATPLKSGERYHACVVPTFAVGRAAGLALPLPAGLDPAWKPQEAAVTLPVYHHWEFTTGEGYEFAKLVRALRFQDAPPGAGIRPIDVAGGGLTQPPGGDPMPAFAGALCAPRTRHSAPPPWVKQALAALAAAVIRDRQEDLAAAAWTQAGQIRPVNDLVATGELATAVNSSLLGRRLDTLPADGLTFTQLAAPLQLTAGADITTTTTYRRLTRRRGPIARRAAPQAPVTVAPEDVATLRSALDPARSVGGRIRGRVEGVSTVEEDGTPAPATVAPTFPAPMAVELARLAPQFLLPGVERIPPDSVVALVPNPRFVAAFLVGLTAEMAGELRWRGYPLDPRATLFQCFWDRRGQGGGDGTPDLEPLADAPATRSLAELAGGDGPDGLVGLVLAIRGELLRRHPRTALYAIKATSRTTLADESVPANLKYPVFTGSIEPDVRYFGFDLDEDEARGTGTAGAPGWFFAFAEQVTETRFGPPPGGDPLAGTNLTAAEVARRTLCRPLRILIHAAELLAAAPPAADPEDGHA